MNRFFISLLVALISACLAYIAFFEIFGPDVPDIPLVPEIPKPDDPAVPDTPELPLIPLIPSKGITYKFISDSSKNGSSIVAFSLSKDKFIAVLVATKSMV